MATMELPSISSYGQYSSDNYGAHTLRVDVGELTLWFSYQTVVAFRTWGKKMRVSKNLWGPTTGKHLSWIDGGDQWAKKERLEREEFEKQLAETLKELGFQPA